MSDTRNTYVNKLLRRAEGIWNNLGLVLISKDVITVDGITTIAFRFVRINPTQAELLVNYMGQAFRRATVYWKDENGIAVHVNVPPLG